MKILVVGSGGREHALVWKLSQSQRVKKIYCAPGNGGISKLAECVTLSPYDVSSFVKFAKKNSIDLTVVGPELPLSLGIVDEFEKEGLHIFGPKKNASVIESSKCFAKEFCSRHGIPTAPFSFFTNVKEAKATLVKEGRFPLVVKADGLAQGKGVVVAKNREEAFKAIDDMLVFEKFGEAGRKIIIEDFMEGEEATFMGITDGTHFLPLETSQDHKRIYDHDQGPNTGGMGAMSPAPVITPEVFEKVVRKIITPFLKGMRDEDRLYRGIIYVGLMVHESEPKVVEFNCRFGDPEAEVILFRMKSDLVELIDSAVSGRLADSKVSFYRQPSVCVVMASQGYPGSYETNKRIHGLENINSSKNAHVFHCGTRLEGGHIVTAGGRILAVTARGNNLKKTIQKAYQEVSKIHWDGVFYRKDIAQKGLMRNKREVVTRNGLVKRGSLPKGTLPGGNLPEIEAHE